MAVTDDRRIVAGMEQQMAYRAETLGHGASPIGWKVGLGSPPARERLKIDAPLVGFLVDTLKLDNGAEVNIAGWIKPILEAEIAIHIGRDLPDGIEQPADATAAIAALGPAIEVADISDDMSDVAKILAGNVYHRHVILGPSDPKRAGAVLEGIRARIEKNGETIQPPSDLEANTGKLVDIVFHLANLLPRFGAHLRRGDVIIAGSLTAPILVEAGDSLVYALEPFPALRVALTA